MYGLSESTGGDRHGRPAEAAREAGAEIFQVYRELMERLWEQLTALIGATAAAAIFRSSLREAMRDFPFLSGIDVSENGVRLERLESHLGQLDPAAVRSGLLALLDSLVGLLTDLTGVILLRKVQPLLQEIRRRVEG